MSKAFLSLDPCYLSLDQCEKGQYLFRHKKLEARNFLLARSLAKTQIHWQQELKVGHAELLLKDDYARPYSLRSQYWKIDVAARATRARFQFII